MKLHFKRQDFLEDKAQRGPWSLESGAFPGSVLLRLGLGTDNDAQQHPWEEMDSLSPKVIESRDTRARSGVSIKENTPCKRLASTFRVCVCVCMCVCVY